jgi:hypothetical protein
MTVPQLIAAAIVLLIIFLPGVPIFWIIMIPILAGAVILFKMKKGNRHPRIIRAQTIIVITSMLLVLIAGLFPPYSVLEFNEVGDIVGWHAKWEFSKDLRDLLKGQETMKTPDGIVMGLYNIDYMYATETLRLEIFGILVLAGAAIMIAKRR